MESSEETEPTVTTVLITIYLVTAKGSIIIMASYTLISAKTPTPIIDMLFFSFLSGHSVNDK